MTIGLIISLWLLVSIIVGALWAYAGWRWNGGGR